MKTFFTLVAFLFLGTVVAIGIAGSIAHDNRITKEAYTKKVDDELKSIDTTLSESQQKIDSLEEKYKEEEANRPVSKTTKSQKTTATKTTTSVSVVLTNAIVAKHASEKDCWIIVSGKVYSVASYISLHPGGRTAITNVCGTDATVAFTTQGGSGKHSKTAEATLGTFFVGSLGSSIKL